MINYCQDILKKNNRMILDEKLLLQLGKNEDYRYIEIEEAMTYLDDDQRELIHLKYFQDIKIKEIAMMWNCPEGTVKTLAFKALRTLRYILEEKGEKKNV
ncbi:RNA polymerase sigma factor [Metabacillus litoralis]|uniref:RNA polymerase sigma factor n=1 Tax=Metabacillus litoralis TaxID=152268 RepID=UPI001CFCE7A8|nr:sigma factor-like helix-turn-helix DNA-binding protein [Metabacillus litoralis]